jgi:TPR repeat protein
MRHILTSVFLIGLLFPALALREWKPLAEQGNTAAQFGLGVMYELRKGVPQDFETAV